jgi:trigger factor
MELLVQNDEGLVATLTVKISQEDYADRVEKELKKIRQTYQIKGFRPGYAPISLIRKMYGQSIIVDEINRLIQNYIEEYEKDNASLLVGRVIPATNNQLLINLSSDQTDFEFVYEACFYPKFDYKLDENTELKYYNILIEDEEIDEEIDSCRNTYHPVKNVEEIDDNCFVKVNINLVKEGKEETHSTNFLMSVLSDEDKPLFLGAKVDDTVNVEIRKVFPNNIDLMGMLNVNKEELELQPQTLPFTIIEISKQTPFDQEQEFFDAVAGKDEIHSEEELREYIRQHIKDEYESLSLEKLYLDAIEVLIEKANITLPRDFVNKYIRIIHNNEETTDDEYESIANYFIKETIWNYIVNSLLEQSDFNITIDMVTTEMKKIISKEYHKYQIFDEEELAKIMDHYLKKEEYVQSILLRIKRKEIIRLLKENSKLNTIDLTFQEFQELYREQNATTYNVLESNTETNESVQDETETPITVNTENQEENIEKQA